MSSSTSFLISSRLPKVRVVWVSHPPPQKVIWLPNSLFNLIDVYKRQHLTFWGGGCDTQTTLTFGSLEDIRNEVEELIGIFAPGGGFVFTQVHNIQADISPEKIMELYNTANRVGRQVYATARQI